MTWGVWSNGGQNAETEQALVAKYENEPVNIRDRGIRGADKQR